jgi:hypothetical protein
MESKILERIKKLIKKAESAKKIGSIEEANAFSVKVQQLLAKHNLEMSQIDLGDKNEIDDLIDVPMKRWFSNIGGNSSYDIMRVIAQFNWCHVYNFGNHSNNLMKIIGKPENIEVCQYIHETVSKIFIDESRISYKKYVKDEEYIFDGRIKPVAWDTYARTFMKGCAKGLKIKLQEEQERFKQEYSGGFGLIKTNELVLTEYATQKWSFAKGRRTTVSSNGNAYAKGVQVGKNVSLNKGVGTSSNNNAKLK